jgi:hypothetical protein
MEGGLKLNAIFCFMQTNHEPFHLVKWNLVQLRAMDMVTSFICIILFTKLLSMMIMLSYVGTNAGPFCVEFCYFVQKPYLRKLLNNMR